MGFLHFSANRLWKYMVFNVITKIKNMFRTFLNNIKPVQRFCLRNKSEPAINIEEIEQQDATFDAIDEDANNREVEIERKRDKSRLKSHHRNIVHDLVPQSEPTLWVHGTLKYARSMYGRYGSKSGLNLSLCWPTKQELTDKLEYESIAHPYSIHEMVNEAKQKRIEKETRRKIKQDDVINKMEKLEQWKLDLKKNIDKKESVALAAKEKKDRLIEEVRRHFGYTVDPKDEKFKELLEKKEKEQKKAMKQAKKKAKEEKYLAFILNKPSEVENPKDTNVKPSTDSKQ